MFILEIPQNFNWNKNSWLGKKKEWNSSDFHVYSYKYLFNDLNQTGEKYNKFWDQVGAPTCILTKKEYKHAVVTDVKGLSYTAMSECTGGIGCCWSSSRTKIQVDVDNLTFCISVGSYHFILDALSCILLDKIFCTWSWLIVNAVPHSSVNWEGICKGADRLWNVLHLRYVLETLYTILSTGDNA